MDFTTVEKNAAGIGNDGARQNFAQRRLSRAVVADQPKALAASQHKVDPIKGLDGAKGLADVLHLDPDRRAGAQHPLGLSLRAQRKRKRETPRHALAPPKMELRNSAEPHHRLILRSDA